MTKQTLIRGLLAFISELEKEDGEGTKAVVKKLTKEKAQPETPIEPEIKMEDLIKAAQAFQEKHGREKAIATVHSFGATNIKDTPKENYKALMAALND